MTSRERTHVRYAALVAVVLFAVGSFGELEYWMGAWTLLLVVPWVAVLLVTRGRSRLSWLLLVVPIGLGPAVFVHEQAANPCGSWIFERDVATAESVERAFPPRSECRVVLDDGSVEYEGTIPWELYIAFGWWGLATAIAVAPRPRWTVRAGLVAVTWLVASFGMVAV